jgi:hypothetical protein
MMPTRIRRRRAWLGAVTLLGTMLMLAFAATLQAQVLSDPRIAEFDPSPDHWAVLGTGQPAVLKYELDLYVVGASAPFGTLDMGKPSPDADGKIRYDFAAQIASLVSPGTNYEARVSAIGPEGEALSDPSNPFTFTSPFSCAVFLTPESVQAAAGGGRYAVEVATGAGCAWTVATGTTWLHPGTASGSGNGRVEFDVDANSSTSPRSGDVTIGDVNLVVNQDAAAAPPPPCTYSLSPTSASVGYSGGSATITLTTGSTCGWTASASQSWLGVSAASGTGGASITVNVAANTATSSRTGTVTVGDQTFTVTQAAAPVPECSYSVTPTAFRFTSTGGSGEVDVFTGSGCTWAAVSDQSWLVPTVSGGSGNGRVPFTVRLSNSAAAKTARLTVGPWVVTVSQDGKVRRVK